MNSFGVYVHFPWCRRRCSYCDFPIAVAREDAVPHEPYLDAILRELEARARDFAGRALVSIYFGGGTPSLWRPDCLARAVAEVRASLGHRAEARPKPGSDPASTLEITLEANPTDCTPDTMAAWLDAGINRLSIGVQSFEARTLVTLGRDHRMGDGRAALERALGLLAGPGPRAGGFRSLSADFILGVPGDAGPGAGPATTPAAAACAGALRAAELGAPHLSIYELTIEPGTPLGRAARAGRFRPLDDDALADAYEATHHALVARGYEHYEISSYALPGHQAVHNSLYWSGGEYLGLGNGAASFRKLPDGGAIRTTNTRAARGYMTEIQAKSVHSEEERLTPAEVRADALWLALRTTRGAAAADLSPADAQWLLSQSLADRHDGRIIPTLRGFLYANRIAERLFGGPGPAPP